MNIQKEGKLGIADSSALPYRLTLRKTVILEETNINKIKSENLFIGNIVSCSNQGLSRERNDQLIKSVPFSSVRPISIF